MFGGFFHSIKDIPAEYKPACGQTDKKANGIQVCMRKSVASRARTAVLYPAPCTQHW